MADVQQVVDDIRAIATAVDQTRSEEMARLAEQYAGFCSEANERLRRCADYLHRGLRSEAIHLAEAHPPLLDMVAALDLPELPEWETLCATYELPRPPRLMMEAAQELNEAYSQQQPLQSLLTRHRVLALARSPLSERISVMRELAALDRTSSFWEQDIATFEQARLREIHAEVQNASRPRSARILQHYLEEIESPAWRAPVPPDLRRVLKRSLDGLRQLEGLAKLREMLPALELAHSAMSFDECASLTEQWKDLAESDGLIVPADLQERVAPIMEWVADQRARREAERKAKLAFFQLDQALDASAPIDELKRLHREAGVHNVTVPEELERRYSRAVQADLLMSRRRRTRNLVLTSCVVVAVLAGVGWATFAAIQANRADAWRKQIAGALAAGKIADADDLWKRMVADSASLANRKELRALRDRLAVAQQKETHRRAELQRRLESARTTGVESGDLVDITEAEKLAANGQEKLEVLDLREKIDAVRHARQQKVDQAVSAQVEQLAAAVTEIQEKLAAGGTEDIEDLLRKAESRAKDLTAAGAGSVETQQSVAATMRRVETLRTEVDKRLLESTELKQVVDSTASAQRLSSALTQYAQKLPNSPRSVAFEQAVKHADAWLAVENWRRMTSEWAAQPIPDTTRDLDARLQQLTEYAQKHPSTPVKDDVARYEAYLKACQNACASNGPWKGDFAGTLNSPLMRELKSLRTVDSRTYFFTGNADDNGALVAVDAVITNDIGQTVRKAFRKAEVAVPPGASAQSKLAEVLLKRLDALSPTTSHTFGLSLAATVRADRDIDPILKAILLARVFRAVHDSGFASDSSIEQVAQTLASLNAEEAAWMNPDDATSQRVREDVVRAVDGIPDLQKMIDSSNSRRATIERLVRTRLTGRGVVLRDGNQITVRAGSAPEDGGGAFVVAPADAGATLLRIATAKNGRWLIEVDAARMVEGSMVFVQSDK